MSACVSPLIEIKVPEIDARRGNDGYHLSRGPATEHGRRSWRRTLRFRKRSGDLNDLYVFLDPNDNSRVVVILTAVGFTVPGEGVNFSVFDHELVFEFQFETTGDASPDQLLRVRFSRRVTSGTTPQID